MLGTSQFHPKVPHHNSEYSIPWATLCPGGFKALIQFRTLDFPHDFFHFNPTICIFYPYASAPPHPTTEMPHKTRIPPQTGVDRLPISLVCQIPPMQAHSKGLTIEWTRGPVQSGAMCLENAWLSPTWRARLLPKKSVFGTNYDLLTLRITRSCPAPPFNQAF